MSITKKKYKLTKMRMNTYYLELMLIFLNISQLQKLMKKVILTDLIFEEKRQETLEKNLIVNLLELIQVNVMMKIMKLVECKHLLVSLKIDN